MPQSLRLMTLLILSIIALAKPAQADSVYMVLEQTKDGVATHRALDLTEIGDGIDPVAGFIAMDRPTDPETAQVLWHAHSKPVVWDKAKDNNQFNLIKHAILPEASQVQYRIYMDKFRIELGNNRHSRKPGDSDWGVAAHIINRLSVGEYRVEAFVIIPGRPTQVVAQRLSIINTGEVPKDETDTDPGTGGGDIGGGGSGGGVVDGPVITTGFTKLTKHEDTTVIYISDSQGNDANDGLSPATAVKTLKRGIELARLGKPDWLLLKAGDTWDSQSFDNVQLGGSGADRPFVISTYGEGARPLIIPPHGSHGLKTLNHEINGLVIQGLHFYGATRDPGSPRFVDRPGDIDGINIRIGANDNKYVKGLIIEDCIITHFDSNIKVVDDWSRFQGEGVPGRIQCNIRRNIVRFASATDSHSIGIYIEGSIDSIIEQNVLDHNGWAQTDGFDKRDKASHNIYAQWANGPITVRYNIITRGAAHGLQLRAGGIIEHNIFARNAMAFFTTMTSSRANYNIILESDDMDPNVPEDQRGYGINGWGMPRYEVVGNIVARRAGSLQRAGIDISAEVLVVKNNTVYAWQDERSGSSINYHSGNAIATGNRAREYYDDNEPNYVDPTRGLATYAGQLGLEPTTEAFINYASNRKLGEWPNDLEPDFINGYIRAGFEFAR